MPMTAHAALAGIWSTGGGDRSALERVTLTGSEPALPSSFHMGVVAQSSIAASALAAAEIWRSRTGQAQPVAVDMRHAVVEFRSERYMRVPGFSERTWDTIAGLYRTGDGRHVRLHTNFPHHRDGMLKLLGAEYTRASVQEKLKGWKGEEFETAAAEAGLVATMTRSPEEWAAHGQGRALSHLPLFEIIRIGDAPPRAWPKSGARPLSGIRVLDLTRVIAGPVCGRTLAAHGADVLLVTSPKLPSFQGLVMDTGRGKLSTHIDLTEAPGRQTLEGLIESADVFVQGYRPGAIASKGFSPEQVARIAPGIVCVSLSAYGHEGPWSGRRGFDSLVQNTNGLNHAEGAALGIEGPKELPCQALDHGSGYLLATGAMMALERQRKEGGSWLVRVSLAQTGAWIAGLGRIENGFACADPSFDDVRDLLETTESGFGAMTAVKHSAQMSVTPVTWDRPSVPLGTHPPRWPDRPA
jgi:crotonobetainyl-CoA:carnitine CoA-transferase CaiB-like acyl-CoA transferase